VRPEPLGPTTGSADAFGATRAADGQVREIGRLGGVGVQNVAAVDDGRGAGELTNMPDMREDGRHEADVPTPTTPIFMIGMARSPSAMKSRT
jgi:hypothetical protein